MTQPGHLMKGGGFGIIGDLVVGLIGALIGGFLIGLLFPGTSVGLIGSIVVAVVGAVILVLILHLITGRVERRSDVTALVPSSRVAPAGRLTVSQGIGGFLQQPSGGRTGPSRSRWTTRCRAHR